MATTLPTGCPSPNSQRIRVMEFKVSNTANFASLIVSNGYATLDSGLLDNAERKALARELILAADDLFPSTWAWDWHNFLMEFTDLGPNHDSE